MSSFLKSICLFKKPWLKLARHLDAPHAHPSSLLPPPFTTAATDSEPTGLEKRAGRLALRCLARGRGESEWRGRTVSRALERRPANVSLSSARYMQGRVEEEEEEEEDEGHKSGGGLEGFFGGRGRKGAKGVWEKE